MCPAQLGQSRPWQVGSKGCFITDSCGFALFPPQPCPPALISLSSLPGFHSPPHARQCPLDKVLSFLSPQLLPANKVYLALGSLSCCWSVSSGKGRMVCVCVHWTACCAGGRQRGRDTERWRDGERQSKGERLKGRGRRRARERNKEGERQRQEEWQKTAPQCGWVRGWLWVCVCGFVGMPGRKCSCLCWDYLGLFLQVCLCEQERY